MATFEKLPRFVKDFDQLSEEDKARFREAAKKFVVDLKRGKGFRPGLRVRGVEGTSSIYEMTWAPNGRATFHYGRPRRDNEAHIVWRRIGTHSVLGAP